MDKDRLRNVDLVIFGREEDSIEWFNEYLKSSKGSFSTSVQLFQKYYHKCFQDLINLKFNKDSKRLEYQFLDDQSDDYRCNYINQQDIDHCLNNNYQFQILSILRNNSYLRDTCLEWNLISKEEMDSIFKIPLDRISKLSLEELYYIFHDPNFYSYSDIKREKMIKELKLDQEKIVDLVLPLLKIHRLNNLQIKYAHTARVVYLADYEIQSMGIDSDLVKNSILTSALFHDVGRFYQGAFYNSFDDSMMRNMEGRGRGHAEAGYYYSLLNMISLNSLGVNTSEDLVIHAIASLVVSRHQASNQDNKSFDQVKTDMKFSSNIDTKLLHFIFDAYLNAEPFQGGVHSRFGSSIPHEQKYMKNSLDNILRTIRIVAEQYISDSEKLDEVLKNMEEFLGNRISQFLIEKNISKEGYYNEEETSILKKILKKEELEPYIEEDRILVNDELSNQLIEYYTYKKASSIFFLTEEEEKMIEELDIPLEEKEKICIRKKPKYGDRELLLRTPELNQILNDYKEYSFCKSQDLNLSHFSRIFSVAKNDLAKFAQFDISKSIRELFDQKASLQTKLDPEVQAVIDLCLNVVMDADKLDIFVQRVNKRWDNWNPSYITVRSDTNKNESFIDVLENVFGISLEYDENGVVLNDTLRRILIDNCKTNTIFRKNIESIVDLKKDSLSLEELKKLNDFLRRDYASITIDSKVSTDSSGKKVYDSSFIGLLNNLIQKNPKIKEEFSKNGIVIHESLINEEIPDVVFTILKENHISLETIDNRIKVSYDTMKDLFPDEYERIEKERNLILPKDLREKMFLFDKDREKIGNSKFPLGRRASSNPNFDWANIFPAIWWHIDQFILTNMRSGKSFQFIEDTGLLDRLRDTYASEECNSDFVHFIDEVIDYAKEFIHTASLLSIDSSNEIHFSEKLEDGFKRVTMLDDSLMIKVRDEASRRWEEKHQKNEIHQMMEDDSSYRLVEEENLIK